MSQTKGDFCKARITELIDNIISRESIPKESESYSDLSWIKFYVKDLLSECKGCAESHDDTPSGSKNDN